MTYTEPLLPLVLMMIVIGLLRSRRGNRSRLLVAGVLGLLLASWPPVDWLLSRHLEAWYPIQSFPGAPAQAIVVLGSDANPPRGARPYPLPDRETFQRCEFAAWLHTHWQPLPVLASGGPRSKASPAVAATMRQLLLRAGVPEAMTWTEENSHSTHENAVLSAEVLRRRGISTIALVVEANSMPRAAACFRKQGIAVVPAPCEFRTFEAWSDELLPSWKALRRNEMTLHETVGLAWYWIRRWI